MFPVRIPADPGVPGELARWGVAPAIEAAPQRPFSQTPEPQACVLRTFDYDLESKPYAGTLPAPGLLLRGKAV